MSSANLLAFILRFIGSTSLLALIFVAAPYQWMDSIHSMLGMGKLPDEPVVGYLARSTSAFYAILGALFWVLSFDLARNRPILVYFGTALPVFGLILIVVDWVEGLPMFWAIWEGPFVILLGLAIRFLSKQIDQQ